MPCKMYYHNVLLIRTNKNRGPAVLQGALRRVGRDATHVSWSQKYIYTYTYTYTYTYLCLCDCIDYTTVQHIALYIVIYYHVSLAIFIKLLNKIKL